MEFKIARPVELNPPAFIQSLKNYKHPPPPSIPETMPIGERKIKIGEKFEIRVFRFLDY